MQDLLSLRTIILRSGSFLVPTCSPKLHSYSPVLFVCFGLCLSFELVFSNVWFSWLSVYVGATKKIIGSLSLCDGEGFGAVVFFRFPVAWVVFRRTLSLNLVPSESQARDKGLCASGLLGMWFLGEVRDREEGNTVTGMHHQVGREQE